MHCIKCKKEIDNTLLRCTFCNTKVQTVCPVCTTKNPITAEFCSGCGLRLIKYCPACKRANLPDAKVCRKCGTEFEPEDAEEISITQLNEIINAENQPETIIKEEIEPPKTIETPPVPQKAEEKPDETLISLSAQSEQIIELPLEEEYDEVIELESLEEDFTKPLETPQQPSIEEENPEPETIEDSASDLINTSDSAEDISPISDLSALLKEEKSVPAMELQMPQSQKEQESEPIPPTEEQEEEKEDEGPKESAEPDRVSDSISTSDQSHCKVVMSEALRSNEKLIIGLSGEEGFGKSTVLKYLFNDLINQNYNWLWGECSANSQISPYGIFQEMFLTFFNCPNYTNLSADFQNTAFQAFEGFFPDFNAKEITNLFNFLYPTLTANYEQILTNKDETFNLIEKTLIAISKKAKLVITIDDFDMIDGASYEFLVKFIDNANLSSNLKLVIAYKDKRIAQGYFLSDKIAENQYQDIHLGKLDEGYIDKLVRLYLNGFNPLPEDLFHQIAQNSDGNSAYVEQILILLNENEAFYPEDKTVKYKSTPIELNLPKNIYEVLTLRLETLQKSFPMVYKTLCIAAIMGNKFNIALLELIMKMNTEDFQNIMKMLTNSAYISQFNNSMYVFKNTLLWKIIYEKAKQSREFVTLNEKIFDIINSLVLSSNAIKALIAQNLNQKLLALNIWTENTKLCAYLGDEHLWALSQKQSLKIAQEVAPQNNRLIINNIYERLGKLLYKTKPVEAVEYLSFAIAQAINISNVPKTIELSGYLSKSCAIVGNYHGVIEAIDTILKLMTGPEQKLQCALIKYKKLNAMLSIGNSEEIYNLASNEIIPVVEQALSNVIPIRNTPIEIIYETWLETNLIMANALSIQGNNKCFQILSLIDEIVAKNNVDNKNYLQRVKLAKALAYSLQGNLKKSEEFLIDLSQETSKEIVEPEIISQWNFINILNKLYKRDWANIKEDMFSVVTFANNYNDVLVKNLLKIFLGKVLQEEGNLSRALEIYNEQVSVFAKEKIAIGALLCWYYIAKITLVTDGSDKALDIAQKALEVAKNPKINSHYFIVMYKKLIAEIFIIKGDLESAKMYIEKSLMIVKNYDMKLQKVLLYQLYAKYLEEMSAKKPKNKNTYAQNAFNTYKKALTMIEAMDIPEIEKEIRKNLSSFKAFCQLNGIKL